MTIKLLLNYMDVALLQYILKKKKEGISDEEISQKLLSQGWPKEAIDEGLHHVASHPEQVEFHEQTFSQTLVAPMELLNRSFELLMQNIGSVILLSFVPSVLGFLFIILSIFIPFIFFNNSGLWNIFSSPSSILTIIIVSMVMLILTGYIYAWCYTAIYELFTVENERIGWREALKRSFHKIIPFSWTLFLYSFVTVGGLFLFVIPGIVFTIWFAFAPILFFTERESGMNALLKSREYVRGLLLPVFLRLLLIFGCLAGVSILSALLGSVLNSSGSRLLGQFLAFVVNLLITPFTVSYMYLLFKNIRSVKGSVQINPKSNDKIFFLVAAFIGILLFFALVVSIFMVLRNVSQTRYDNATKSLYQLNTSRVETALETYYMYNSEYPAYIDELSPKYLPDNILNSPTGPNYQYTTNYDKSSYTLCPTNSEKIKTGCISSRVNVK